MKKRLTQIIILSILVFSFFGCSGAGPEKPETLTPEPAGDFNGIITAQDAPITYYVSFWIDKKNSGGGVAGYHYDVYSSSTKEYASRVWTSRVEGALDITVTNSSISNSMDVLLTSNDGGNSYTGYFYINVEPFTGTITRTWLSVASKNDLIGSWRTDTFVNKDQGSDSYNVELTNTFTVNNDFSGEHENKYDYFHAKTAFKNSVSAKLPAYEAQGYIVKHTNTDFNKYFTLTKLFTASQIDEFISSGRLKICQSKEDIQFDGTIYTKKQ